MKRLEIFSKKAGQLITVTAGIEGPSIMFSDAPPPNNGGWLARGWNAGTGGKWTNMGWANSAKSGWLAGGWNASKSGWTNSGWTAGSNGRWMANGNSK